MSNTFGTADDGTPLTWEVTMPAGKTTAPWMLTIDAAHWVIDDGISAAAKSALNAAGYAVVHPKHRLAPAIGGECSGHPPGTCGKIAGQVGNGMFPQQNNDLEMAVAAAKRDPRCDGRVGAIGGSGGGYHACWLQAKGLVFAAVAFSPATQLVDLIAGGGVPAEKGKNFCAPENYIVASPALMMTSKSSPLYLASFVTDLMPASQHTDMVSALNKNGVEHANVLIPGSGHSWAAWPSQQAAALAFLKAHLPPLGSPTPTPTATTTPTPSPTQSPTATPSSSPTPTPTQTPPLLTSVDPVGIYEYGSGDTYDYVNGWAQVLLWKNGNRVDGQYDWATKIDPLLIDAAMAKKQLSIKVRCLTDAPDWLIAMPGVESYPYTLNGSPTTFVLPWNPIVEAKLFAYVKAFCLHVDGKVTYLTIPLGVMLESHMPTAAELGLSMSQADFAKAYTAWAKRLMDTFAANLKQTHFMIAAGAVWKGDMVTAQELLAYGLKYPLFGAQQWGLNAKSSNSFWINKFIQDNDAGRAGFFQMTGASDGSSGGNLQGTLEQCLKNAYDLGADGVEVYHQDTQLATNAAVLRKYNALFLAKRQ